MSGIERGLDLIARAAADPTEIATAQQTLRNWQHRLDTISVLDNRLRHEVRGQIRTLHDLLSELSARDHASKDPRQDEVLARIELLRRDLIALFGANGLE